MWYHIHLTAQWVNWMNYFRSILSIRIIMSAKLKSFERKNKQEVDVSYRSPEKAE